jgi:hypothetical protein
VAIDPKEFAAMLGAEIVGEVPDVGGGPFGMARLARIMHQRLTPSQGERPGRPTDASWENRPKVPMTEATQRQLTKIAEQLSTPERRVSPMQVAAQLLEEALARLDTNSGAVDKKKETTLVDTAASHEIAGKTGQGDTAKKKKPKLKAQKPRAQAEHHRNAKTRQ